MDEIVQLLERFDLGPISLLCVAALIVIWRTWQAERAAAEAERRETAGVLRELAGSVREHTSTLERLHESVRGCSGRQL